MPNWCTNTLIVIMPDGRRDEIMQGIMQDGKVTFRKVLPEPPDMDLTAGRGSGLGGVPDWYEWRMQNWGTKWDAHDTMMVDVDSLKGSSILEVNFNTAWAPPMMWLVAASKKYPEAQWTLAYDEPGNDFGGFVTLRAGEEIAGDDKGSRMMTWSDVARGYSESAWWTANMEKEMGL